MGKIFEYVINGYSECKQDDFIATGVVYAETMGEAVDKLYNDYHGEDDIDSIEIIKYTDPIGEETDIYQKSFSYSSGEGSKWQYC